MTEPIQPGPHHAHHKREKMYCCCKRVLVERHLKLSGWVNVEKGRGGEGEEEKKRERERGKQASTPHILAYTQYTSNALTHTIHLHSTHIYVERELLRLFIMILEPEPETDEGFLLCREEAEGDLESGLPMWLGPGLALALLDPLRLRLLLLPL